MRAELLLTALTACAAALGQEVVLNPDPTHTTVRFTLPATLHTVHGSFKLAHGAVRFDPATGKTLWHVNAGGSMLSSPMTYMLDGRQYVVEGVQGVLYAWALPE